AIGQEQRSGMVSAIGGDAGHYSELARSRVPHLCGKNGGSGSIKATSTASTYDQHFAVWKNYSVVLPAREMHATAEFPGRRGSIQVDHFSSCRGRISATNHQDLAGVIYQCR